MACKCLSSLWQTSAISRRIVRSQQQKAKNWPDPLDVLSLRPRPRPESTSMRPFMTSSGRSGRRRSRQKDANNNLLPKRKLLHLHHLHHLRAQTKRLVSSLDLHIFTFSSFFLPTFLSFSNHHHQKNTSSRPTLFDCAFSPSSPKHFSSSLWPHHKTTPQGHNPSSSCPPFPLPLFLSRLNNLKTEKPHTVS